MRILSLKSPSPLAIGHEHGETLRQEIKEIASIRLERMCILSGFKNTKNIKELAQEHLPILKNFDHNLFLELKGISEGSNVSLEEIIVINHYTDMRDINNENSGCSVIYTPGKEGPILGQTWDTHYSATPYVVLLKLKDKILFSIAGCLGMSGLNQFGVGVTINNLKSIDAKVGIVWPALVRKVLKQKTAKESKEIILNAPIGSGHHYAIADEDDFYSIETSGTKKKVIKEGIFENFFHTNHCLDDEMKKTNKYSNESKTLERYEYLINNVGINEKLNLMEVFLALKKVSLPKDKDDLHKPATCGAIVMDIKKRQIVSCMGLPSEEILKCPQNFHTI